MTAINEAVKLVAARASVLFLLPIRSFRVLPERTPPFWVGK